MLRIPHFFLLITLIVTLFSASSIETVEAGQIKFGCGGATSLANVAPDTIAVLNYVAQNVDHDICVTSAYRSPSYNAGVGGVGGSQHTKGKAIDLTMRGLTDNQRVKLIHTVLSHPSVKGFGHYINSQSLHFDTRPNRTGKGYWGTNRSSSGFDAEARAGKIHSVIVGMVYRWSGTGSPGEMGTGNEAALPPVTAPTAPVGDCPNFNVPLDPNSAEGLSLIGSSDTNAQSCALQRIGTWQAQNPGQGTQPPPYIPPAALPPSNPNIMPPSLTGPGTSPGTGSGSTPGSNVFPQYPLPGAQPRALSPSAPQPNQTNQPNTSQPQGATPTPPIPQCSASSTPTTAKKIPDMTPQEWDRAVRILHAESGSCPLGKNDVNCIKVAETFRNRLIYSMETGKNSCWSTWDRILTFTNASSCGYFDKIGMARAARLQAGSQTYKNISDALFQAVYGGSNLSLGNLHNFTTNYHSRIVDQSSVVPAGGNYTYIKQTPRESRVNISPYHFPGCSEMKLVPDTSQTPPAATTPGTQPAPATSQNPFVPQTQPNINPITQNPYQRNPGLPGAGQGFLNSSVPRQQNYPYSPTAYPPYGTSLQQAALNQQQYTAAQNQLRQQQQELLRLEIEEPHRQAEIRKQLIELQRQQDELLKLQLAALQQQQQAAQKKPSGDRPVTVIAAPNMDYMGVVLTTLAGKLQARGHDVIMMPDAANYQPQLDKVAAQIKALPTDIEVNCVGWNKGALGCVALSTQLAATGHKLHHLVLIDPTEGIDGSSVPGVAAHDFATNKIAISISGKIILYLPEAGSSVFSYASTDTEPLQADEVYKLSSTLGNMSLGLDPALQSQIVSRLTNTTGAIGNIYNVDLPGGSELTKKIVGLQGLLYIFKLSKDNNLVSPIVMLQWLGNSIGSLFGSSDDTGNLTVSPEDVSLDLYLLLIQELLFSIDGENISQADSDVTISALKATQTLSGQYRFFGSIKRTYSGKDAETLKEVDSHFNESVTNELLIDLDCDGSIDEGVTFVTPYNLVLPTADGAEATISEYLLIEEDGLHCFMFYADADNVIEETNEDNNDSSWREFIAGFGAIADTPTEELPSLNFEVSVYNFDGSQMTQNWTSENITITAGQQIAFRWDAPEYDTCSPLLSSLSPNILDNTSTANRNTLTEKIDLEERTGYYEVRCEVNGDTKVEYIHVTVE